MIRYWGEPYEGSDDHANDLIAAESRKRAGIRCDHCRKRSKRTGYCAKFKKTVDPDAWCESFVRKNRVA